MSAGASSVATLQQQAAVLAQQIQTDYAKLDVLDEGYNQAHLRVTQLQAQVLTATRSIGRAEKTLAQDNVRLRTMAIDAYVDGDISSGLTMLLNGASKQLPMQQAYLQAASREPRPGRGHGYECTALAVRPPRSPPRRRAWRQGGPAEDRRRAEPRSKDHCAARERLATVKGNLAQAVAAAEQQRQLQAEAAAEAAALANQQRINQQNSAPPQNLPPVSGGGSGAVAVRAAESQLGVPYVWGGATPGVGFDCSGLTMWSWEQAGVSLAHGATDQYYEIAHVSMSNLQPGDLIFYGDSGYLYHVVMYVGSGPYGRDTVIQAEETGTNVMFTPIPPGAYGAGQP